MLTLEQVLKVAALARLELSGDEPERFRGQLSAVLDAVTSLEELDTSNVAPTSHAGELAAALREDAVVPSLDPARGLANAPEKSGTSFVVPRVLE
jgi:aspartyl-tRNA(Asn)/glutamyl-tRNA(Gln) amidotransferase subunit C